jgi:hypothetical protein
MNTVAVDQRREWRTIEALTSPSPNIASFVALRGKARAAWTNFVIAKWRLTAASARKADLWLTPTIQKILR